MFDRFDGCDRAIRIKDVRLGYVESVREVEIEGIQSRIGGCPVRRWDDDGVARVAHHYGSFDARVPLCRLLWNGSDSTG